MIFAANHRTYNLVRARLAGSRKREFLLPRLEEQIPPVHPGPVLGSQQREAMNRTIAIPRLAPVCRDPQKHLLAGFDGDLGTRKSRNLVTAVAVSRHLNDVDLRAVARASSQQSARKHDPDYDTPNPK